MAWGWKLYRHAPSVPYRAGTRGSCTGPDDLFLHLLRNAGLAQAGAGLKLATDAEIACGDVVTPEREAAEPGDGRLF